MYSVYAVQFPLKIGEDRESSATENKCSTFYHRDITQVRLHSTVAQFLADLDLFMAGFKRKMCKVCFNS